MSFDINIIGTGSSGNCIVINNELVVDIGLSYSTLKDVLDNPNTAAIFVTHRHIDHLQPSNINQLRINRPWLIKYKLYTNANVLDKIRENKNLTNFNVGNPDKQIIDEHSQFEIKTKNHTYNIQTFKLVHDVPNQGFVIKNELGESLIYATDTETMEYAPNEKFDYILVEGNYDEDKVNEDLDFDYNFVRLFRQAEEDGEIPEGYENLTDDEVLDLVATDLSDFVDDLQNKVIALIDRANRNSRHLSVQEFEDFCRKHSKPTSIIYQLHESEGFGLRSDLSEKMD